SNVDPDHDGLFAVDPIINDDPGQVYFSTGGAGTTNGSGGTWEVRHTFQQERLNTKSKKSMQVNGIHVANTTVDPSVDLLNTPPPGLTFTTRRTVAPTLVDIESTNPDPPAIVVGGVIETPLGTTRVVNHHADIHSTGSRTGADADPGSLIRTNILDL